MDKNGWDVSYLSPSIDYATNLDKAVDRFDLVWGVGFMADATLKAAKTIQTPSLLSTTATSLRLPTSRVMFRACEPSFVVGYIAARTTKTGIRLALLAAFLPHLSTSLSMVSRGGVDGANKEKGHHRWEISAQYAESFSDARRAARLLLTPCTPMVATLSSTLLVV